MHTEQMHPGAPARKARNPRRPAADPGTPGRHPQLHDPARRITLQPEPRAGSHRNLPSAVGPANCPKPTILITKCVMSHSGAIHTGAWL
jgi:hypothetical protein